MKNKPEFLLAGSIFIALAFIGTIFGVWYASQFAHMKPRTNTDPQIEAQPPPPAQAPVPVAPDR